MDRHTKYAHEHIKPLRSQKPTEKTKQKQDSSTEVNTVFCGPRVVFGARVNKKLKEQFVEVAKQEYGSVCRLQEAFMAAVLAVTPLKVNSSKTITIEKIVIERNLRPRRYATGSRYTRGERESNRWDPKTTLWYYDPEYPDDGGVLDHQQRHGHVTNKKFEEVKS